MEYPVINDGGTIVGRLDARQNRAYNRTPMIRVDKYHSEQHALTSEVVAFDVPVVITAFSFAGSNITRVSAPRVIELARYAFRGCSRLFDLRDFHIDAGTDIDDDAFFNVGTDSDITAIYTPSMSLKQIRKSGLLKKSSGDETEFSSEIPSFQVRDDVWFCGPDNKTCDALKACGVPTKYPDGTMVGVPVGHTEERVDTRTLVENAVALLDKCGAPVKVVVDGEEHWICDDLDTTDSSSLRGRVFIDPFVDKDQAIDAAVADILAYNAEMRRLSQFRW